MFLRTRLHVYLLWATCAFAFLAIISGLLTDGGGTGTNQSSDTTTLTSSTTTLPSATTAPRKYVVQPGESLFNIALKFKLSAPALVALNNIKNADNVAAGTELLLPPSTGFVPIGATTTMKP